MMTLGIDTNDRSGSTDDPAAKRDVSPMAPFRLALNAVEYEAEAAWFDEIAAPWWRIIRRRTASARQEAFVEAREILFQAIKEATDIDEAGRRSSTPSG
jgi:hypothetical protein